MTTDPGSILDDERVTEYQYAYDLEKWILDRSERVTITDSAVWAQESRWEHNDRGMPVGEWHYLDPETRISAGEIGYDDYGNVITRTNPSGFMRTIVWDPDFHTFSN